MKKKIIIKETKNCDTRSIESASKITIENVEKDTKNHIEAVVKCGDFICDKIKSQFHNHDNTKLGDYLPAFTQALKEGFLGKEFKTIDWWEIHKTERHHLNDRCPDDVNLIDVLEMLCDCVSAGKARTGNVYDITIDSDILQKAVKNTVLILIDSIEVEE